jgi:hypothetical protein
MNNPCDYRALTTEVRTRFTSRNGTPRGLSAHEVVGPAMQYAYTFARHAVRVHLVDAEADAYSLTVLDTTVGDAIVSGAVLSNIPVDILGDLVAAWLTREK